MRFQRHILSSFDARSVTLFAALALGSAVASAQSTAQPMATPPAAASPAATASASDAFKRADTNGDQRLSRDEAKQLPVVAQNFDRLDTDKDGSVSIAEFDKGVKAN